MPNYVSNDLNNLKEQTKYIMTLFAFPIRKNLTQDDSITISTYPSNYLTALFKRTANRVPLDIVTNQPDMSKFYYESPAIGISSILDSIIYKKRDTSKVTFIKAHASLAHELTHYLQDIWRDDNTPYYADGNTIEHYSQPVEFQAYTVTAYYFFYFTDLKILKKTMNLEISKSDKAKRLINAYLELLYPKIGKIFTY